VRIRAGEAAEVRTPAGTDAGDEKGHVRLLRRNASARAEGRQSRRCKHISLLSSTSGSMIPKLKHIASVLDPVSSASASVH